MPHAPNEPLRLSAQLVYTSIDELRRLAAVDMHAPCELAYRMLFGVGVVMDTTQAIHLYRTAALAGCPTAAYNLALCHLQGWGVPKSLAWSIRWSAECERIMHREAAARCYD